MSKFRRPTSHVLLSVAAIAMAAFAGLPANAQMSAQMVFEAQNALPMPAKSGQFDRLAPRTAVKRAKLDYSIWDDALENVVLDFGPSTRRRARRPDASVGTRFVRGHKSAYRLEGSRVTFSYLNDAYRQALSEYRKDLQAIATQVDITKFSRDEQLAFWFNLHNVALIEQIAKAYPIDRPANIKIRVNGERTPLDEAKFISVKGVNLSLRDIREKVVYANWSDSNVIYGFFRGNIGSPKLPRIAYTSDEVQDMLKANATEFVNSLRGFHEASQTRNVSVVYEEAKPFYFRNWDADLTAHLLTHAERETVAEVQSGKRFKTDKYDSIIADLSAGNRLASSGNQIKGAGTMSFDTMRLLSEVEEKQRVLRRKGIENPNQRRGFVIIEDMAADETSIIAAPPQIITDDAGN